MNTKNEEANPDIKTIWELYKLQQSDSLREKLVLYYIPLVRSAIKTISIPTASILTRDDLISSGIIGLIDAIEKYDPTRGVKFETYALQRIKGAILDELRRVDWLSRSARQKAQEVISALESIQNDAANGTTLFELSSKLDIDDSEINRYLSAYQSSQEAFFISETTFTDDEEEPTSLLESIADEDQKSALDEIVDKEKISIILDFLNSLPERNRLIMTLYYYENLKFKEIGKALNLSESRVCQVHSEIIEQLKKKFKVIEE